MKAYYLIFCSVTGQIIILSLKKLRIRLFNQSIILNLVNQIIFLLSGSKTSEYHLV